MGLKEKIWQDGMRQYEQVFLRMLQGEKCGKVLELGCGNGEFAARISSKLNLPQIIGIDNDRKKTIKAESLGLKVILSDLNQPLPFDDTSFDLIFSNFVIEHLFDADNFVNEIKRVLLKGGCAIVGTENLSGLHNILALLMGMQPFPMTIALSSKFRLGNKMQTKYLLPLEEGEGPHVRVFAYQGLRDIFDVYSFKVEKILGAGYPPFMGRPGNFLASIDPRHAAFNLIKVRKISD